MKRAGYWIIFGITCLLVAPGATNAGDTESDRATLKGLRGVMVIVESIEDPEVERAGLAQATFQTDVEVKLRQAGIKVLSGPERSAAPGKPVLYLHVNVLALRGAGSGLYAYSIHLELLQGVVLERNIAVTALAPTWRVGSINTVGANRLSTAARERVRDDADNFINAWLSVNPK